MSHGLAFRLCRRSRAALRRNARPYAYAGVVALRSSLTLPRFPVLLHSHNSSRLLSSDSPFKKPPPRSRHQPGGRKPGGQPGRRGVTRSLVEAPDQYVIIPLPGTCAGGRGGTGIATTGLAERRQVVEVVIQREVIEYRIVSGTCACGRVQRSTFPAGICSVHDSISAAALPVHRRGAQ